MIDGPAADTGWIDRVRAEGGLVAHRHSGVALVAAGIEAYETEEALERTRLIETARGGRPQVQHRTGRAIDLKLRGNAYKVTVFRTGPQRFRVVIDNGGRRAAVDAELDRLDAYKSRLTVGGTHLPAGHRRPTARSSWSRSTASPTGSASTRAACCAPPPRRWSWPPRPRSATRWPPGAPVLVLESMKMETVLNAPFAARVKELLVSAGSQVETGAPLVRLEPVGDDEEAVEPSAAEASTWSCPTTAHASSDPAAARRAAAPRPVRACCSATTSTRATTAARWRPISPIATSWSADGRSPLAGELGLLEAFADFAELSPQPTGRRGPAPGEPGAQPAGALPHLPAEPRSRARRPAGGLPRQALPGAAALRGDRSGPHARAGAGGVPGLPGPAALGTRRPARHRAAAALDQRAAAGSRRSSGPVRDVLDRLVTATQLRFPVVGDLARSVRFRWFDQPLVDAERQSVLGGVAATSWPPSTGDAAPGPSGTPDRRARPRSPSRSSGSSPSGSKAASARRRADARGADQAALPRATAARPARGRASTAGRSPSPTTPPTTGRPTWSPPIGRVDELAPGSGLVTARGRRDWPARPPGTSSVRRPLPVAGPRRPSPPTRRPPRSRTGWPGSASPARCAGSPWPSAPAPAARSATSSSGRRPSRRSGAALVEDVLVRGVHPMVGRRLTLGRLREFDVTRLDAPEDVLLYRCVAPDNPADQRLVALAQVRQLAVVRDEDGRVVGCRTPSAPSPTAWRRSGGSGPRAAPPAHRLDMNYVWVHIWPTIDADVEQLTSLQEQIAPMTAGAGIEEVLVGGTVALPDGAEQIAGRRLPLPARIRRRDLARRPADRAAQAAGRLRARRWSGPAGAASSTPTSCRR